MTLANHLGWLRLSGILILATKRQLMDTFNGTKTFHAPSRKAWRAWLQKNHDREQSVWLIIHGKQSKARGINQETAVEEALCFGWIDSKSIKRDDESRYQYFSRRKPKSAWSKINRARVERLTQEGLMTPAGQALIDLAKESGTWEALVDIENGVLPDDLKRAFARNKTAFRNFEGFSPSSRKMILTWIHTAKREETRKTRIEKTVKMAAKNLKAYP